MTISPVRGYRPEKALIEHMVAAGMEADAAETAVRAVVAGMQATITGRRSVYIPGVGRISAKDGRRYHQGRRTHGVKFVRTALSSIEIFTGEPWEIEYDLRRG